MRKIIFTILAAVSGASGVAWIVLVRFWPRLVSPVLAFFDAGATGAHWLGPLAPIARLPFALMVGVATAPLIGGTYGAVFTGGLAAMAGYVFWNLRERA